MILSMQTHRAPSDTWYPILASNNLDPGSVLPVTVDSVRLAVWRSAEGDVSAWGDQCPHRGMRLSFGAVRGETLLCPYHGWTFDKTAQCTHMPAHPDVTPSKTACAHAFGVSEQGGYVWVNLTGSQDATQLGALGADVDTVRTLYVPLTTVAALAALVSFPLHKPSAAKTATMTRLEAGSEAQAAETEAAGTEAQAPTQDKPLVFDGEYTDGSQYVAAIGVNSAGEAYSLDVKTTGETGDLHYGAFVFPSTAGYCGVHVFSASSASMETVSRLNAGLVAMRDACNSSSGMPDGQAGEDASQRHAYALQAIGAWLNASRGEDVKFASNLEEIKCTE